MPTKPGSWASMAGLDGFKAEQRLRKDLLGRDAAQNLVDIADLDLAGGRGLRGAAVLDLAALGLGGAHIVAVGGDFVAQAERRASLSGGAGQNPGSSRVLSAMLAAWLKGGVSISSRYCWFCAAARLATSSTHSPVWRLLSPPKRSKVAKN